jgi:hypothetical protein
MRDISVSYNRYKFLGNEFLTWIWFQSEKNSDEMLEGLSIEIGNRIVIENRIKDAVESVIIKGDEAGLEEGILALRKGAVVTEINLVLKETDQEWRFTLKGESLGFSGLKTPETGAAGNGDDREGALLEKAFLYQKAAETVDNLFIRFVRLRLSTEWEEATVPLLTKWINGGRSRSANLKEEEA